MLQSKLYHTKKQWMNFQNKSLIRTDVRRWLLQSATTFFLLQSARMCDKFITNCNRCYKMQQIYCKVRQQLAGNKMRKGLGSSLSNQYN